LYENQGSGFRLDMEAVAMHIRPRNLKPVLTSVCPAAARGSAELETLNSELGTLNSERIPGAPVDFGRRRVTFLPHVYAVYLPE
jgi:hypothetical protein